MGLATGLSSVNRLDVVEGGCLVVHHRDLVMHHRDLMVHHRSLVVGGDAVLMGVRVSVGSVVRIGVLLEGVVEMGSGSLSIFTLLNVVASTAGVVLSLPFSIRIFAPLFGLLVVVRVALVRVVAHMVRLLTVVFATGVAMLLTVSGVLMAHLALMLT